MASTRLAVASLVAAASLAAVTAQEAPVFEVSQQLTHQQYTAVLYSIT